MQRGRETLLVELIPYKNKNSTSIIRGYNFNFYVLESFKLITADNYLQVSLISMIVFYKV